MIDREALLRIFILDSATGQLFWGVAPRTHPRLAGKEAGFSRMSKGNKAYWVVRVGGVAHKRARLIFMMLHGHWPTPCIDHIDGNSLNDVPGNLREATITENAWNHHKRSRRIKLPMGVRNTVSGKYGARISFNKQQIHLGSYDTPAQASEVYQAKRKELYGQFA